MRTLNLWEDQYGKFLRQQVRAASTRLPTPSPAHFESFGENMDRFVMRGYHAFPTEPFAQSDAKSSRLVVLIAGAVVLDEVRDFPVNASNDDWDLSHPDVEQVDDGAGGTRPMLKTSGTFEGDQGATFDWTTSHLDDATPPNPSPEVTGSATIVDNVAPSAPLGAAFKAEGEINVP